MRRTSQFCARSFEPSDRESYSSAGLTSASKAGTKNVPLTTFDGKVGPPEYKISADAETTVLMWTKSKVKVNEAFEAGKLSKDDVAKLAGATAKILE